MTDDRRAIPVAAIAGALFCLVLIYLALQIRSGNDPAIGAGNGASASPREVVVRRVIVRRVIESDAPAPAGSSDGGESAAMSAPATAEAAPAPAAPPPPPAPVVSRGS